MNKKEEVRSLLAEAPEISPTGGNWIQEAFKWSYAIRKTRIPESEYQAESDAYIGVYGGKKGRIFLDFIYECNCQRTIDMDNLDLSGLCCQKPAALLAAAFFEEDVSRAMYLLRMSRRVVVENTGNCGFASEQKAVLRIVSEKINEASALQLRREVEEFPTKTIEFSPCQSGLNFARSEHLSIAAHRSKTLNVLDRKLSEAEKARQQVISIDVGDKCLETPFSIGFPRSYQFMEVGLALMEAASAAKCPEALQRGQEILRELVDQVH